MSERFPTGCDTVDALLNGGVERGAVTQLYGSPGSGKTNIALNTAVETVANGENVVFIDTEGVSDARLTGLLERRTDDPEAAVENIYRREPITFDEQRDAVQDVGDVADNIGLVVLDSATGFYRLRRADDNDEGDTLRAVADQIVHLLGIARRNDFAVIITNQVYADIEEQATGVQPLGGNTLNHWTSTVIYVEDANGGPRKVRLEKHRAKETGDTAFFSITDSGLQSKQTVRS